MYIYTWRPLGHEPSRVMKGFTHIPLPEVSPPEIPALGCTNPYSSVRPVSLCTGTCGPEKTNTPKKTL